MKRSEIEVGDRLQLAPYEWVLIVVGTINNNGINVIWFDMHGHIQRDCIDPALLRRAPAWE